MFFDFFILIARLRLATSYIMELVRRSSPTPPVRVLVVFWAERGFSTRVGSLSLADASGLIRSHIRSHCHEISFVSCSPTSHYSTLAAFAPIYASRRARQPDCGFVREHLWIIVTRFEMTLTNFGDMGCSPLYSFQVITIRRSPEVREELFAL